jgi:cytosine deaminase
MAVCCGVAVAEGGAMAGDVLLRGVRPPDGERTDLLIRAGRIAARGAGLDAPNGATIIDAGGRLLFPGLVDAHAHLDKSLLGLGWRRNEVGPAIMDKIEHERAVRREGAIDFHQQSARAARLGIAGGTTHFRTFVDIDTEIGLRGFEGVKRTREELRDAVTMQIVAFPQSGILARPGTLELLDEALRSGADVIGGLDPSAIDRDPAGHLDAIFALAGRYDVDVDIHLHEPGELGAFAVELIIERTRVLGWRGRVVISHAFCLGDIEEAHLGRLLEGLIEQDIAIMSHGPSGLRAAPPVKRLHEAGVRLCTGNDGIRDAWGPLNMADMLLRTFIVAYRNNFRRDDELALALNMATYGGARVIGDDEYGLQVGNRADLVLVDSETHPEAIIERPARWLVLKGGRVVAREGACLV